MLAKVASTLDHIIGKISDYFLYICGIAVFFIMMLTVYGVFRRYALDNPEPYSYEISVILFLACVLLSLGFVQRNKRNLRVDFISNLFPRKIHHIILEIFVPLAALVYIGFITYYGLDNALYSLSIHETSQSVWREPLFPIKIIIPVGLALLFLVILAQLIHGIIDLRKR
jgi:TRAP-type C4-dicarboxylate transport system permease small subunit